MYEKVGGICKEMKFVEVREQSSPEKISKYIISIRNRMFQMTYFQAILLLFLILLGLEEE